MTSVGDSMSLLYPKWVPGIHAPGGPVHNIAGFMVNDGEGNEVRWQRDWSEVCRFFVYPDDGAEDINVLLTYITNQPTTNSKGIDSYGTPELGIISWNTIFVYPEGIPVREIQVRVRLILPPGWSHGSALEVDRVDGDTIYFEPTDLEDLVDKPLICGINFRTIEIVKTKMATYYIHIAADDAADLPDQDDSTIVPLRRLALEAEAMFGRTHFDKYHFLLALTGSMPTLGLEHRNSSLNGVKANEFRDAKWDKKRAPYLLPHEFAHAWCGKYRRPAGMYTDDFQTVKNTNGLWLYEGLDQYLGYVLTARCGYDDSDWFVENTAFVLGRMIIRKGRDWRPLQDTEVSAYSLRGGSPSWAFLRRGQDYYAEGAMIWLEFDCMIRNATDGQKSLDDFCAAFFSNGDADAHAVPFDREEIVATLSSLADGPWDSLITVRVDQTHDSLDSDVLNQIGYELGFTDSLPKAVKDRQSKYKYNEFYESLGLTIKKGGKISEIVPGSIADSAGLFPGSEILGVDGKKFSIERIEDALKNSPTTGVIRLLVTLGDNYHEVTLKYDGGPRYYKLTPVDGKAQWLEEIAKPRTYEP